MLYWDQNTGSFYEGSDDGYNYLGGGVDDTSWFGENDSIGDYWTNWDADAYNYTPATESFWNPADLDQLDFTSDEAFANQVGSDPGLAARVSNFIGDAVSRLGNTAKNLIFKSDGTINAAGLATLAAGAYKLFGGGDDIQTGGYNRPVPKMTAVREAVDYAPDPNRRPGAGGRRYFTDPEYVNQASETYADDLAAAQQRAQDQATGIRAAAPTYSAPAAPAKTVATPWNTPASDFRAATPSQALPVQEAAPMAEVDPDTGGLMMARGGQVPQFRGQLEDKGFVIPGDVVAHADPMGRANKERGLRALHQNVGVEAIRGPGDAMSDSIPTTIDGKEPARVANGEAYVPRQNVARLGGGDMDKGANRLYDIMDTMRQRRTGSTKQINPDNPQELRAAYGGAVNMAAGGEVKRFEDGGTTSTDYGTSTASSLSPWVGDYVTDFLGQAQAAAAQPYQAYTGPLTAGASDLQQQAFAGASSMANTGYTPTQFSGGLFDTQAAQQYMNPYLSAALDPQMQELKRQADIARLEDSSRLTKAGAYGGSRQAIMESEGRRNLLDKQNQALAQGYSTAYDKAMAQFNADQARQMDAQKATEASRQYSAEFGRQSLADLAALGKTQRDIESEGIAADKAQFEEERGWQYQMPQYLKDLLGANLPVGTSVSTPNTTGYGQLTSGISDLTALYKTLSNLGQTPTTSTTSTTTTSGNAS